MKQDGDFSLGSALPRPGPALRGLLIAVLAVWLCLALAINWGSDSIAAFGEAAFGLGAGSTGAIAHGQLWRLVTASFLHNPQGLGHVLLSLLGLYFLAPSLEQGWGARRFLLFLLAASVAGYGLQALALLLLPSFVTSRLVPDLWFGSLPVVEAIAIAWATSFRNRVVQLFFVLPVSSRGLALFVVGASVLAVVAADMPPSGLVAPFGGMFAGYLLGGEPMTIRRWWLSWQLRTHERQLLAMSQHRRHQARAAGFRVIEGGQGRSPVADEGPDSEPRSGGEPPVLH
ncbi:MAG: rhomboid family intramembrane serine protease [Polyangiaceae bacterium]|nr:rhomboid family intramembrane serine protease [Polyangiaceae bacterium]